MRRFYAPKAQFDGNRILLDEGETKHLRDVLRLGINEIVQVFDGEGNEYECVLLAINKRSAELELVRSVDPPAPESPLRVTLAAAVTPAEKFDLVVQKSVELGVVELIPVISIRTEIKLNIASGRLVRWQKIAFEAAKQCGRARVMQIHTPLPLEALFLTFERSPSVVFFSERNGGRVLSRPKDDKITIVVGPKGGWDDRELDSAREAGCVITTFGGRIMRAETAAISLAAIIQNRFGDLN